MRVAFLFNSDAPEFGGNYGRSVAHKILSTRVLQNDCRHIKVSLGDILTYGKIHGPNLLQSVYSSRIWDRRKVGAIEATFDKATIYTWLIHNITVETAGALHAALLKETSYLGSLGIDYSYLPHFAFFGNGLIERYRLHNGLCSIFYSMGMEDGQDISEKSLFENSGYTAQFEDMGARRSIFDNYYDSVEHHGRVSHFSDFFRSELDWVDSDISDLNISLEELHPYLFDILFAATKSLEIAEVKEQLSQAYLSGRRFLEHAANFLFPPRDDKFAARDGSKRAVGNDKYINRYYAYIEEAMILAGTFDIPQQELIGKAAEALYGKLCSGVHKPFTNGGDFQSEQAKCLTTMSELGRFVIDLININPSAARRPYLAYGDEILRLFSNKEAA